MPQSCVQQYLHFVFSTKNREAFLSDPQIREEMYRYLGGVCRNHNSPPLIVGGYVDHVHVVCRLSKGISVETFIRELKVESSKWTKTKGEVYSGFHWQSGYGAFSVSPSHLDQLIPYVERQEEHHRMVTFQEEYLRLLGRYAVDFDERYLWD